MPTRHSLRWRLPFLVSGLLAVILATFLFAAYRRVEATLVRAAGERAQGAADQVASLLDGGRAVAQLEQLGADGDLRHFLETRTDGARAAAEARLNALAGAALRRIELWDAHGTRLIEIVAPGPTVQGTRAKVLPPGAPPFAAGIAPLQGSDDIVFSDTVAEVRSADASAKEGSAPATLGYVLVRSTFTENPPGIFGRLVGRDAVVRIGNQSGRIWTDFSRVVPAATVDLSRAGVTHYETADGQPRLGAVSLVKGTPWAAWVDFPLAAIVAPAQTFLNQMIPIALLVLTAGAVLASVVTARITGPLSEVTGAAEAIAAGDYTRRVTTSRRDEIGRLGRAFNAMTDQVEGTHQRLEARVAERTEELQTARVAADRANLAKSEFLSRMSHDLRTPLNAIMGFAQVLQLENLTSEQADSVKHILRGGRHLLELINEVLDIARIEAGRLSLSPEPIAVKEIVEHAIDLIRPLATRRGLTIEVESLPNAFAFADRQRLNQILFNLLSNAVKYNRDGGIVRVSCPRLDAGHVSVVVGDTGAGIPPEKLKSLFTPFERLGAEQLGIEGTGLGLALAKGLAEAMNGSLTVKSVIDEGSAFRLDLPACEAVQMRDEPVVAAGKASADSAGALLYIEDNLSNLRLMEKLVEHRPGVMLVHAPTGRDGVTLARERRPGLIFLDLHLPDCSGEEVLRQLWENPQTREIPVAVLSADATPAQKRRMLASGAMVYLTKPFDIVEVLRVIDQTLGLSTAARGR